MRETTLREILLVGKQILTDRQFEVLVLHAQHRSDLSIAWDLGISEQRVRRIRLRAFQLINQHMETTDATAA